MLRDGIFLAQISQISRIFILKEIIQNHKKLSFAMGGARLGFLDRRT